MVWGVVVEGGSRVEGVHRTGVHRTGVVEEASSSGTSNHHTGKKPSAQ